MSQKGLEWKVGLFAVVAVALIAALVLQFSKGIAFFTPSYEILARTRNVGGIKKGAAILMAGVPVGSVRSAELTPDGRQVLVRLGILSQYQIHGDAVFAIEQAGFLGDQYVSVVPGKNVAPLLKDGALVFCEEPFNFQETARAAMGFLQRVEQTAKQLSEAVGRLDRTVLSETNLENLTVTFANFRAMSEEAMLTLDSLGGFIETNSPPVTVGVSNLVEFSGRLNRVAVELEQTVTTNRGQFSALVKNVDSASGLIQELLADLQAGKGLAGSLLKNEQLQTQANQMVSNLTVLSSNLTQFGLLYRPRPARRPAGAPYPYPAKR